MKGWGKGLIQFVLVVVIVSTGLLIARGLIATKPRIERVEAREVAPLVRVETVRTGPVRVFVDADGTVEPSRRIELVPEVSGKALYVSENLVRGGRFRKGELLIKIDDSDYIAALKAAEAELKRQEARLHQLQEESKEAEEEWREVDPGADPPPLLLRIPDIEATEAAIEAARASLQRARLDLQRTEIRAPFSGVVISENLDAGQYLRAGQSVAEVFSDERVEIRVSLNERDTRYIEIPGFNTEGGRGSDAEVEARFGGRPYEWEGWIERAEIIDRRTRTIPVVVVVRNPYATMPPLSVGAFVRVRIKGRVVNGAVLLDRAAVQWTGDGRPFVWLVDDEAGLRRRMVEIAGSRDGGYIIKGGLEDGDRVVLTPPPMASEGMKVRTEEGR
jgi:RND family efflux transporter MFP subunit